MPKDVKADEYCMFCKTWFPIKRQTVTFVSSGGGGAGAGAGWGGVKWLERCASISKITDSNPSGGRKITFRSHLLLTARGSNT
jgi:hypothetical protein